MSFPPNKLSEFHTYSYHQFLILCSSTSVAESIGNAKTDISDLQHPPGDRYKIRSGPGGQYVTLVDGTADAHLNITKSTWKTIITPEKQSSDGVLVARGPSVTGIVDIHEPNGASFLEVVSNASNAMNVSMTVAIYAIKTIFIGHSHNKSKPPVYVTNISPFTGTARDISAIYDSTGAKYRIQMVGTVGGSRKLPQQVFSGKGMGIKQGQTLKAAMAELEKLANAAYDDNIQAYNDAQIEAGEESATIPVPQKYEIIVGDELDSESVVMGDNEQPSIWNLYKDPILNLSPNEGDSVITAIDTVLKSSSRLMDSQKAENPGEPLEIRNTYSITDTQVLENGVSIHKFHIGKREVVTTPPGTNTGNVAASLTFEYLFTGKNVDIIEWDMKLTNGVSLLNQLGTTNTIPDTAAALKGSKTEAVIGDTGAQSSGGTEIGPSQLLPGAPLVGNYTNARYPVTTANFYNLLSKQAGIDSSASTVTIHGNVTLLGEMATNPSDVGKLKNTATSLGPAINGDWINKVTTVRLNVKIPKNPDDLTEGFRSFWFRGLYRLVAIEHFFKDGRFTQELTLYTIPGSHPGLERGDSTDTDTAIPDKTTPKGVTRDVNNKVTPIRRAETANFSEIKEIAIRIANEEGVDPNLVLGIIKQESSFRVDALGGKCFDVGTASGLMQVCPTTAEEVGISRADLFIPEQNIRAGTRYIKKQLNTNKGDVVLALAAYNAGPGNVRKYNGVPPFKETEDYVKKVPNWSSQFEDGSALELRKEAQLAKQISIPEEPSKAQTILTDAENETAETVKSASLELVNKVSGKLDSAIPAGLTKKI